MTKVRTNLGGLFAVVCVLGLLLAPTTARADEGDEDKGRAESSQEDDRDEKDDDRDRSDDKDDAGDEPDSGTTSTSGSSDSGSSGSQGGNLRCPAGTVTFTINNNPGNGSFSDGTVTVTTFNSDSDSFNWTSNLALHSVLIKGGPETTVNAGGTSGFAVSAFNPDSGQNYGISHVTICYTPDQVGGTPPPPPPPCDADLNMPGIQPCGPGPKVCPPNSDFPGSEMDDLEDCFRDDVGGEVITNPVEVCPSGPFKGMPMTSPRDCVGPDQVLPNVIRNQAGPGVEAAPAETAAAGGALPFTGAGGILQLLGVAAALLAGGLFALRARRND